MSTRLFDHIDLRVKNRETAQSFYEKILPAIGFRVDKSGKEWGLFEAEGGKAVDFFGFTEESDHRPNGNRIAFWAPSRDAVDKIAEVVRKAGGKKIEGPELLWITAPVTTQSFLKIRTATSSKSAIARARRRQTRLDAFG